MLATLLRVHSNSEVSYLPWQNMHSNLKSTCHIKLKFFFWTKLLENLLLAKYLISVTGHLNIYTNNQFEIFRNYFFIHLKENNKKLKIFTFWETALTCPFSKVAIKQLIFTTILVPKLQLYDILLYLIIFTPISMFYTSTVAFGCKFTPYHIQQLSNFFWCLQKCRVTQHIRYHQWSWDMTRNIPAMFYNSWLMMSKVMR